MLSSIQVQVGHFKLAESRDGEREWAEPSSRRCVYFCRCFSGIWDPQLLRQSKHNTHSGSPLSPAGRWQDVKTHTSLLSCFSCTLLNYRSTFISHTSQRDPWYWIQAPYEIKKQKVHLLYCTSKHWYSDGVIWKYGILIDRVNWTIRDQWW